MPYGNKLSDVFVLMAIGNGELPAKPLDLSDTKVTNDLWDLCQSCWTTSAVRPTARQISEQICTTISEWDSFKIRNRFFYHGIMNFVPRSQLWRGSLNCVTKDESDTRKWKMSPRLLLGVAARRRIANMIVTLGSRRACSLLPVSQTPI